MCGHRTLSGLKVTGPLTFTIKLSQKFSTFPDTLGYNAFVPLPQAFFTDHAGWLKKPVGNGPYTIDSYTKGSQMALKKWDAYPGTDKAQNGGVTLMRITQTYESKEARDGAIASGMDQGMEACYAQLDGVLAT